MKNTPRKVPFAILVIGAFILIAPSVSAQALVPVSIEVNGWSNDGKVLLRYERIGADRATVFTIIDLVTDKVLWSAEKYDWDQEPIVIPWSTYKIKEIKSEALSFPMKDQKLGVFDVDLKSIGTSEDATAAYMVYISKTGGKSKSLGSFDAWGLRPTGKVVTGWSKSPFENRIVVLAAVEFLHPEFDNEMYEYHFLGCHLGVGF